MILSSCQCIYSVWVNDYWLKRKNSFGPKNNGRKRVRFFIIYVQDAPPIRLWIKIVNEVKKNTFFGLGLNWIWTPPQKSFFKAVFMTTGWRFIDSWLTNKKMAKLLFNQVFLENDFVLEIYIMLTNQEWNQILHWIWKLRQQARILKYSSKSFFDA